ncbi:MAG: aldehyde ferredoxin oxidoreductase C-terminal domain-containing protein [Chloroflexota bacterium]
MTSVSGYAGKFLRVDLSSGRMSTEDPDEPALRKYLGGTGFGSKILYEEVPPGVEFSDPENRVVMASGPLAGTSVNGSGTFSIVTKGPLTNGAASVQANGFFGAFLKFSGFDGIIVQGAGKKWQYLYIHDGMAELRDAGHVLGKDNWETEDAIKAELGAKEREMSVFSIGPAGENLVRFATIAGDKGHIAAHNGTGAVLGSKKLKAVAVARGKSRVTVADRERLASLAKSMIEYIRTDPHWSTNYYQGTLDGIPRLGALGHLPVKNYQTSIYAISEEDLQRFGYRYIREHFKAKRHPCWACPSEHTHTLHITDGPYAGFVADEPEYEGFAAWGPLTGNTDVTTTIVLANEVDRLGFDTNEAGFLISLVMECYEKGLLTSKDTDGLEMTWGNVPAISAMLKKTAHREGFGNVLAEGTMRAAKQIGGEAPDIAIHTMKGNAPRGHDHRSLWWEMFDTCVSDTGTIESHRHVDPRMLGFPGLSGDFAGEEVARAVARVRGVMPFEDSLGICRFTTRSQMGRLADMLQAATGWDYTAEEGNIAGRRFANLLRAFNVRHGHTPGMEAPSRRYGSTPIDGPAQGKSIMPEWQRMLDAFYQEMGWDLQSGKPFPETLKTLGLEHIAADLW